MGKVTLITGGVRSGKSQLALDRGDNSKCKRKLFIATTEPFDREMEERVRKHKEERGDDWKTVEEPCKLDLVLDQLTDDSVVVIDCCTVWLGNVWHKFGNSDDTLQEHIEMLCDSLLRWKTVKDGAVFIVSNEVGWGIVPEGESVRRYRDWAGKLNQLLASLADEVLLCVCGIPVKIK